MLWSANRKAFVFLTCLSVAACWSSDDGPNVEGSGPEIDEWAVGEVIVSIRDRGPGAPFHEISDARVLSSGRIVLVDGGSRQLSFFGADGTLDRTVGREGDGPGEFRRIGSLTEGLDDTIAVYDPARRTLQLLHPTIGYVRSEDFVLPSVEGRPSALWRLGPDQLVHQFERYEDPAPRSDELVLRRSTTTLVVARADGEVIAGPVDFEGTTSGVGPTGEFRLPFTGLPIVAVDRGRVVFGSGATFRVAISDSSLREVALLSRPRKPEPITEGEISEIRGRLLGNSPSAARREAVRQMLVRDLMPNNRPELRMAVIDPELDRVWVGRYEHPFQAPTESEWFGFLATGQPFAHIVAPPRSHLVDASGDRLLFLSRDEYDVISVVLARVGA